MTPDRLAHLLRTTEPTTLARTSACPDEQRLAAYVDGAVEANDRAALERHLADCDACLALVGFLAREIPNKEFPPIAADTRSRVEHRGPRVSRDTPRYAAYLSVAAALFLGVAVLVNVTRFTGTSVEPSSGESVRAVRKAAMGAATPELLYPRAGARIPGRPLAFRWTAVPGSRYYEIRILNDAGDVIADQRVTGTSWQPPTLALQPGTDYYVHVDAYLAGDRTIGSEHIPFRVVP